MHPHLLDSPGFFERFRREAEIGSSIRINLGLALLAAGRIAEARESFERAGEIARRTGNRHMESKALANLALSHGSEGRPVEARDLLRRSLALCREILAAWREEFGDDDDATDGSPTESATRAG